MRWRTCGSKGFVARTACVVALAYGSTALAAQNDPSPPPVSPSRVGQVVAASGHYEHSFPIEVPPYHGLEPSLAVPGWLCALL